MCRDTTVVVALALMACGCCQYVQSSECALNSTLCDVKAMTGNNLLQSRVGLNLEDVSAGEVATLSTLYVEGGSLTTRETSAWEKIYDDYRTGADKDFAAFRPKLFSDEFRLFYLGKNRKTLPQESVAVVSTSNPELLKPPKHFVCKWTDRETGGYRDGSLWEAIPPTGYKCLSDVAIFKSNSGNYPGKIRGADEIDDKFRCVREDLVTRTELGNIIWTDRGSGGKYNGAVWAIKNSFGMKVGRGAGDVPSHEQWKLKAWTGQLYRDLQEIACFANEASAPATYSVTMTRGLTQTTGNQNQITAAIAAAITAEASSGVEGIASTKMSATVSAEMGTSSTFSTEETQTQTQQFSASVSAPPWKHVCLYQLVALDDKNPSLARFKINSRRYTTKEEELKPDGDWEVVGTGCKKTNDNCITSSGHPKKYGDNQNCNIHLPGPMTLKFEAFNTESRHDFLTAGGIKYSGTTAPPTGLYDGVITWDSDYSITNTGWKVCSASR